MGPSIGLDAENSANGGNTQGLAALIFNRYVLAFEATSALLITAAVGAMVLAHRERLTKRATQADLASLRMKRYAETGQHPGPLPTPGVFARHNAVDTPALLPDGSVSELSVSATLRARSAILGSSDLVKPIDDTVEAIKPDGDDEGDKSMSETHYLVLAVILFTIGTVGFMIRRNAIVAFMCVELMLNASNLALVTFSRKHGELDGQVAAFFVMVVAAAEVVVGLAIIVTIFRTRRSASVDDANLLKF